MTISSIIAFKGMAVFGNSFANFTLDISSFACSIYKYITEEMHFDIREYFTANKIGDKNLTLFKEEKSEHILLIFEQIESEISLSKLLTFIGHDGTVRKASINFSFSLSNSTSCSSLISLSSVCINFYIKHQ